MKDEGVGEVSEPFIVTLNYYFLVRRVGCALDFQQGDRARVGWT